MKIKAKNLVLILFLVMSALCFSQTTIPAAQSMFVYNFTRFIEWPESAKSGSFVITIIGNSDIADELDRFCAGKKVGLQNIVIKKVKEVEEISTSQILFISYNRSSKIAEIISKISGTSTLLIGEKSGLCASGVAVNFILDGDKLKFELKVANATKNGLKVNSKLESMAIIVN
jgi:hypothetical protein